MRSGPVVVVHAPESRGLAERVVSSFDRVPRLPGLPPAAALDVTVVLAPDERAFQEAVGAVVPEWGAGVALPAEGRIVLPAYGSNRSRGRDLDGLIRHEWAHVALGRYLAGLRVPNWFHEGYAEWASGGFDATEAWRLRLLLALGRAPAFDSLSLEWPTDRASAEVAYLLSASAVEYLASSSGPAGLATFLATWREEGAFETAFRSTFGLTTAQFEEDWTAYVKRRYGWLLVVSHSLAFWTVTVALLILLVWIRRRRTRDHMARMRAGDPPEAPAYWANEGPDDRRSAARGTGPAPGAGQNTKPGEGYSPDGPSEEAAGSDSPRTRA